jgi:uncharacterized protein YkwD
MLRPSIALAAAAVAISLAACGSGSSGSGGGATGGGSATGGSGSAGNQEPADQKGITEAHNAARAAVQPTASPAIPPLTWSPDLAAVAKAYAEKCVFEHSQGQYGENLYATTGGGNPQAVVDAWVSEAKDYDYATDTCASGAMCGHYTQVVWRDSERVGCGMAFCDTGSPWGSGSWEHWVCEYDPPGNWVGQKPY